MLDSLWKFEFRALKINLKYMYLQFMSNLTEVDTGTEKLLLVAWHVNIEWRSSRFKSLNI